MGLHSFPGSCLAWGDQALGSMVSIVGLMATSRRGHAKADLPGLLLPVPHPCGEPLFIPPTLAGSFGSVSCEVSALFFWVLVHTRSCLCPPRLESLFSPVLWKSCNQIPVASKVRVPRFPNSFGNPQVGSLTWGFEPLQQWANFFGIIVLQSVGHPPAGMRLDFIVIVPLLPSHCGFSFVFGCGVSFFSGFQNLLIDGYSTANAILVLLQEEMSTLRSNLPSPV